MQLVIPASLFLALPFTISSMKVDEIPVDPASTRDFSIKLHEKLTAMGLETETLVADFVIPQISKYLVYWEWLINDQIPLQQISPIPWGDDFSTEPERVAKNLEKFNVILRSSADPVLSHGQPFIFVNQYHAQIESILDHDAQLVQIDQLEAGTYPIGVFVNRNFKRVNFRDLTADGWAEQNSRVEIFLLQPASIEISGQVSQEIQSLELTPLNGGKPIILASAEHADKVSRFRSPILPATVEKVTYRITSTPPVENGTSASDPRRLLIYTPLTETNPNAEKH